MTFLHHQVNQILRVVITIIVTCHGCILIYSCIINATNVALCVYLCLSWMTGKPKKLFPKTPGIEFTPFHTSFMKFRQLQVLLTPTNEVAFIALPFAMLATLVTCVMTGCMLVKFGINVPLPISVSGSFFQIMFVAFVHGLLPLLAEVATKSEQFIRYSKVRNISKYKKKQVKSCHILALAIGPFLKVTKALRIKYLAITLYNMVSLIVLI